MKKIIIIFLALIYCGTSFAYIDPKAKKKSNKPTNINLREDCLAGTESAIQNINNVRATLLSSGDVWWNLDVGQYYVPNTPNEIEDVSSIFAGSVWIGGYEPVEGGQDILKIAATTYRTQGGDWYPGPLDDLTGTSEKETCEKWDRFFKVTGEEIALHRRNVAIYRAQGLEYPKDSMPDNIRYYPGIGNSDFILKYNFQLPDAGQGLGSFYDDPNSQLDVYDPENGDYPRIDVRGCESLPVYPDEMYFWIYNDQAGPHTATNASAIQMEVQVQAFAYQSNDELNDMTFQRYKLINRAQTVIKDCYFAMWVDGDLGCSEDDYIGCDTTRSLAYLYNFDAIDGDNGCDCSSGDAGTYCDEVPILGVDYFRGPTKPVIKVDDSTFLDLTDINQEPDTFIELGMSSFVYTNRQGAGEHPAGTWDCENGLECYNLLDGKWRDGLAITQGGSGYNISSTDTIRYVLPGAPSDDNAWSMCSASLGFGDRRTIQASGPFILKQGAVNELIIGVVWVPDQIYPCPELAGLYKADDLAQSLFDNCFQTLDGPDGPDVDVVELDRQVILLLSNDTILSNNAFEEYAEVDLFATDSIANSISDEEKTYVFEGYEIYQLRTPNSASDLDNIENARRVRQVDLKNGITTLYNWTSQPNPLPENNELVFTPERQVIGADNNISHTFSITEDAFSQGSPRLVNHREYYYYVIAYGYNQYAPFDPKGPLGQQRPYITGRRTFGVVTVVPRPMVYDELNSFYGDGPKVTRLSGVGNQGKFIMLEDGEHDRLIEGNEEGIVNYKDGGSPLQIKVVNPLDVKDGKFKLEILGDFDGKTGELEPSSGSKWVLTDLETGKVYESEQDLEIINEKIIKDYGFSLTIYRTPDVLNSPESDEPNTGFVGSSITYDNPIEDQWLAFVPNGENNFVTIVDEEQKAAQDPTGRFSNTDGLNMVPYKLVAVGDNNISPGLNDNQGAAALLQSSLQMSDLNNVDIVFTSDREKWSKCIVVESANLSFVDLNHSKSGDALQLEIKDVPSVSRDEVDDNGDPREIDGEKGFGWFPGYAIDVETGDRLNIFFGENSTYGGEDEDVVGNIGRDMAWNPTNQVVVENDTIPFGIWNLILGGQHTLYVTRLEYDGCESLVPYFEAGATLNRKRAGHAYITWTGIPILRPETELLSYSEGLIPNDVVVSLRVDNAFGEEVDIFDFDEEVRDGENPEYEFELRGKEATEVDETTIDEALTEVNVVPNPYYGFSGYEVGQNDSRVKITNVPQNSTITIYSIDGRFIAQFNRDARRLAINRPTATVNFSQEDASVVWNLENSAGIPVSSGVYLIHVLDNDSGAQRTIKWFGINRKFDPSGL